MNEGRVQEVDEGAGVQEVGEGYEFRRRMCSGGGGWERLSVCWEEQKFRGVEEGP